MKSKKKQYKKNILTNIFIRIICTQGLSGRSFSISFQHDDDNKYQQLNIFIHEINDISLQIFFLQDKK